MNRTAIKLFCQMQIKVSGFLQFYFQFENFLNSFHKPQFFEGLTDIVVGTQKKEMMTTTPFSHVCT